MKAFGVDLYASYNASDTLEYGSVTMTRKGVITGFACNGQWARHQQFATVEAAGLWVQEQK
jgi:hypothetical protein